MDLRGHLDLLLLTTLRDDGPAHGYALIASLRDRSLGAFDLPEGTVYPALYRLERDGLVGSEWDASAARRRRVYSLTPAETEEWKKALMPVHKDMEGRVGAGTVQAVYKAADFVVPK